MAITLDPEQENDLRLLKQSKYYGLWHEVGFGKTFPLVFRMLESIMLKQGMWIVCCEVFLLDQWKEEIARVVGNDIPITVKDISGSTPQWERIHIMANPPDILIVNYEFFPKIELWLYNLVRKGDVAGMVCDEAHRLKGFRGFRSKHGSRSQSVMRVAHATLGTEKEIVRYMASGSPIVSPNSPDVWGLYYFLNPQIYGPVLWKFESEFFYNVAPHGAQYKTLKLKPNMKDEMSRRMYTCARRLLNKESTRKFPRERPIVYRVEMPDKLATLYSQMKENCLAIHEGEVISRTMLLARLMALQQLSSGFILEDRNAMFDPTVMDAPNGDTGKSVIHIDSSHKDKVLWSILDEVGRDKSVIIWAHFKHELEHIASMLEAEGMATARVWGDEDRQDKRDAIREFKEGKRTHMVAQPASAGAGLNLQIAGHSVRYSRSHRLLDLIQSDGRNFRATSIELHECITRHDLVTKGTYDEYTFNNLQGKRDLSSEITLDAFREMRIAS